MASDPRRRYTSIDCTFKQSKCRIHLVSHVAIAGPACSMPDYGRSTGIILRYFRRNGWQRSLRLHTKEFNSAYSKHRSKIKSSQFLETHSDAHCCCVQLFQHTEWATPQPTDSPAVLGEIAERLSRCMRDAFLSVDRDLIELCREKTLNYASSTGVTALFWRNVLTIAHVGDSRACIAKVTPDGVIKPEWLTVDHKPNTPSELQRIESCGGSLVWLHGVKPYIRLSMFEAMQERFNENSCL